MTDKAVAEWLQTKAELDEIKKRELVLRNQLIERFFPNGLTDGTNKVDDSGLKVKAVMQPSYKVDPAIPAELVALSAVRTKYELSMRDYKALDPENRKALDYFVEKRPSQPQLTIETGE